MIKNLPSTVKLPNYNLKVEFVSNGFIDKEAPKEIFGLFKTTEFLVQIADVNESFNKYLYTTFVTYAIGVAYDVKLNSHKAYSLGVFLYHVLENNNIKVIFDNMKKKQMFTPFKLNVPSFVLSVRPHDDDEAPLGSLTISKQQIDIYTKCTSRIKNVILIHELIEWANTIFRISLKHIEIQSLSEGITYVINNNKFVT